MIQNRLASMRKTYGEQIRFSGVSRPAIWPSLNTALRGDSKSKDGAPERVGRLTVRVEKLDAFDDVGAVGVEIERRNRFS